MELQTMYPPHKDSPSTYLMGDIGAEDTYILVGSAEVLPQTVPFPLTLGFDRSVTETVLVTEIVAGTNQLIVTRSSSPLAWIAGTKCARVFTAYDLSAVQNNISDMAPVVETTAATVAQHTTQISANNTKILEVETELDETTERLDTAITAESVRATAAEGVIQTGLTNEITRSIAKDNDLQNAKVNRSELTVLITDVQYTADAMAVAVTFTTYDANAQALDEFVRYLPIVNNNTMGLMTPEAYAEISALRNEVNALQQQGGRFVGVSFATKADLDEYEAPSGTNIGDFTFVLDDETHEDATTRYIYDGTNFEFAYVINFDPVGLATDTIPGLVLSDDGTRGGKIFVELDGSMSVVGWDSVLTSIANKISANNALITMQLNGVTVGSFTLNQIENQTLNFKISSDAPLSDDTPKPPGTASAGISTEAARGDHRHASDAPTKATTVPVMNGTAAIGSLATYAAANHVHPSDTSRASTVTYTATLTTTWTGTAAPYSQTVPVTGILAADTPIVDVVPSATVATGKLQIEAWGKVSRIATAANSITAYCYDEKPVTAIPIQLKVVR